MASNILFIGDSHTAGPFGKYIKENLAQKHNVAVFGHSSSASYHWVGEKSFFLSGGVYHGAHIADNDFKNPNPTNWKEKVIVPKFRDFVTNISYHDKWSKKTGVMTPDVAVIALGANDARVISRPDGTIIESSYRKRKEAIQKILKLVSDNNMRCIWIAPPDGAKKIPARLDTLYEYLETTVSSQCDFFSSRHFKAKHCDGIHFSCKKGYEDAKKWALEVSDFVNDKEN
jgi:hypothetical protein